MMTALERFFAGAEQALGLLGQGPARARTEQAVRTFIAGARAWHEGKPEQIDELEAFAWEGAGLAAALGGEPEKPLIARPERATLIFVGIGWARSLAGAPIAAPTDDWQARFGPAAWMLLDGQGFAAELFRRRRGLHGDPGTRIADAFDQGRGRALYFVHGGQPGAIARSIAALERVRGASLWRGVGIASRFTDGLDEPSRATLRELGGEALREGEALATALLSTRA
jgi:hypothetical protein